MSNINSLINFIKDHSIVVKSVNLDGTKITAVAQYSKDGVAFSQDETIDANLQAVRNWLGY
jgi:hypothetical protein